MKEEIKKIVDNLTNSSGESSSSNTGTSRSNTGTSSEGSTS
jgi:hypothetical protein